MKKEAKKETEKEINQVLHLNKERLDGIEIHKVDESLIDESERLLNSLGIELPDKKAAVETKTTSFDVPAWETLAEEAKDCDDSLESLFTEQELKENAQYVATLTREFNDLHKLDLIDYSISAIAGILSAAVDILLIGIPHKTPDGLKGGPLANYIRDGFNKVFPEDKMEELANSKISKVPFDAQDNRHTTVRVDGLSAYYHRLLSLGHDPILGFFVGVADIMTGKMTTIDKTGKIVSQVMDNYADRKESNIFKAIAKQFIHFKSDITTSMGLPAPLMGLFDLLQLGSIGEEEQTIAEIVQGMYFEGYDFIHFCSLSIPVMVSEVIVRLCYAIRRIRSGHSIKDSIPISLDREKHPKLATMLFIAHSSATAINAGKVYFTKNPMAINYPQWIAFAKSSYRQLKWVLVEKPELRDKYVTGKIDEELKDTLIQIDKTAERFIMN